MTQYRFFLRHYRKRGTYGHRDVIAVVCEDDQVGAWRDGKLGGAVARDEEVAGIPRVRGLLRSDLAQNGADECFGRGIYEIQLTAHITGAAP